MEALPGEMPGSHRAALLSRLPVADNTLIVLYQEASRVADYLTDPAGSVLEGLEGPEADSRFSPGELATYRHNLAWYRRHAARLDPLFARRDQ